MKQLNTNPNTWQPISADRRVMVANNGAPTKGLAGKVLGRASFGPKPPR